MALSLEINGQQKSFEALTNGSSLADLVAALELKGDRVAIERNGDLAPRSTWLQVSLADGDRLEIVHFVGGGATPQRQLNSRQ